MSKGTWCATNASWSGAKVAGRIATLGQDIANRTVDLGSEVRAGDVLVQLETADFQLKVQQAESQLEQVRATLGLDASEEDSQLDPAKVPSVVQEKALWDAALDNWKRAQALEQETAISGEELQQRKSAVDVAAARYESALHSVNESVAQLGVRAPSWEWLDRHWKMPKSVLRSTVSWNSDSWPPVRSCRSVLRSSCWTRSTRGGSGPACRNAKRPPCNSDNKYSCASKANRIC